MSGTVNIARDIFDDVAFKDQPLTEREAFIWMIMEASWKDRERRVGEQVVPLRRGQLVASIRFLADAWKWPKSTVSRYLDRLKNRDMIGTASGTGLTVITINKYNDYQSPPGSRWDTPESESGTATGQQRDKREEGGKKDKEERDSYESLPDAPSHVDAVSEAVTVYNDAASRTGWPRVQKLTPQRRKMLSARLRDCGGTDGWRVAVEKAEASRFIRGPNNWFGFDWLCKTANLTKLMEGNYDDRSSSQQDPSTDAGTDAIARAVRIRQAQRADRGIG